MDAGSVVSLTSELKGMDVLRCDSEERIGSVTDAVVHPTEGRVVALAVRTPEGERLVIDESECFFAGEAVLVTPRSADGAGRARAMLERGVLATKDLLGAKVVTERGNCLGYARDRGQFVGYIRDVYILPEESRVVYAVGGWNGKGGSFYLAGSVPSVYSRPGGCVEVPRRTPDRFAASSPAEAYDLARR